MLSVSDRKLFISILEAQENQRKIYTKGLIDDGTILAKTLAAVP